jgi:hypothetical protein
MFRMVLGSIANVRSIGGHIQEEEMDDNAVTGYLEAGTSFVENKTGVLEADWSTHEDFALAQMAAENYAAAFAVLVVSTVKDPTARHKELLGAANEAVNTIMMGATTGDGDGENPFFINENSDYQTYENNPEFVAPYESFK